MQILIFLTVIRVFTCNIPNKVYTVCLAQYNAQSMKRDSPEIVHLIVKNKMKKKVLCDSGW